jgi:hypothetical protein
MNEDLNKIQQKINSVQLGLMRFHHQDELLTMEVKTTAHKDSSLDCIVINGYPGYTMANKNVNLIQKNQHDYLYITGKVMRETQEGRKILSVRIVKASWFVRMRKGWVSWLREKYVYDVSGED